MNFKTNLSLIAILLFSAFSFAQNSFTVKGQLSSKSDGLTLAGANVIVKGTTNGVTSDFDGNYAIKVNKGDVLEFSFVGFVPQIVVIDKQQEINIVLEENVSKLSDVIVIGYGTVKKSHLTGAISKVVNENLDQVAVSRVEDALIGKVSGVNIQATNAEAGAAPTITIRGVGSITADSGPAVVVDGIIMSSDFLGNMNMNDIESFEVLKDAASAAIYGSEGANGVILITTKSGKEGKTKFSYETYTGRKEAFGSKGYRKSVGEWADKEFAETGTLSETTQYMQLLVKTTGIDRDWQDVFLDGGNISSHSFSARGGSSNTKFSASLRYLSDEGVVITDDYKFYSAKLKMDSKLNDKLDFGVSITPTFSKRRALPTSIHNPLRQGPWLPIYHTAETLQFVNTSVYPNVSVGDYFLEDHLKNLDLDGNGSSTRPRTSGDANPYAQYVEREHYEYNTSFYGSTYFNYEILKGLEAKTSLGITYDQRKRSRWDGTKHHSAGASRANYYLENRDRLRIISDNTVTYHKAFDNHEIDLLAGVTIQKKTSESSAINGSGFKNDLLKNINGADPTTITAAQSNTVLTKLGYFGRVSYAYADKYLLSASFRRDGSSVFGSNSKYGNFPSLSVGWNVAKEDFLKQSNVFNTLKFRVSYGLTGAENFNVGNEVINAWPYLSLLSNTNAVVGNSVNTGFSPLNIANNVLQWEASKEYTIGFDYGLLRNKISGSLNYYKRTSDHLLLENPVSYVTGFDFGIVNLGEVVNSGLEFDITTKNITNENFSWSSTLVASTNKNELTAFGDSDGALLEDIYGRNSQWINLVGNPISSFYGYVMDKEFSNTYWATPYFPIQGKSQDVIVKDLNGDGIITSADKTILGNPYPELIWSLTNDFKYKNFDFSFMIQGSHGAEVRNVGDEYFYTEWQGATISPAQLVVDGVVPDASFIQARVVTNDIIQSAGYFSLRNVNIGYNMPEKLVTKIGLSGLRIYVTGQNLLYITDKGYNGFNPEYVDDSNPRAYGAQRAGTPLFRTTSLGVNIDF